MKTAFTTLYSKSRESIKEREEKREWRKTYDPTYTPRMSMLSMKYQERRQSVLSMFGRQRDRDSMIKIPDDAHLKRVSQ